MRTAILFLLFSIPLCHGQLKAENIDKLLESGSIGALVSKNTEMLIKGNFYQAMLIADKLLQEDPENANFNYRKGRSMMALSSDPKLVLPYLVKGASSTTKLYNAASDKEKDAPFDAFYYLAKCYHLDADLNSAELNYNNFLDKEKDKKNVIREYAELGLMQIVNARKEMTTPKNYIIKNVGAEINGKDPDFSPAVTLDGSAMYYTSRRLRKSGENSDLKDFYMNMYWEDIYVSYKDENGAWSSPEILEFCTPDKNYAMVSVSKDERQIFTYNDKSGNGDIFVSNYRKGEFQDLEKIDIARINTSSWEPHIVFSPDGNTLYFSSDREGGFGGRDIYMLKKTENGDWSRDPINLGPEVNSAFDEDSPFISLDGKTLYFASNGPKSMGGFDVLKAQIDLNSSEVSRVENMGIPLNSTHDDIFLSTVASGEVGYFTSYRVGGYGEKDIYEVSMKRETVEEVALLRGVIKTMDGSPLPENINAKLICKNCDSRADIELLPRMRDGVLLSPLEKCKEYELVYFDREEELNRTSFSTDCTKDFQQIDKIYVIGGYQPKEPYHIVGLVVDDQTNNPVANAIVTLTSLAGSSMEKTYTTDANGRFVAHVLNAYSYGNPVSVSFNIEKEGFLVQSYNKTVKCDNESEIPMTFRMTHGDDGEIVNVAIEINPIYYDLDKSYIRDDAEIELDKIVKLMNDNPNLVIEVGSHTDCRHSAAYNLSLSNRRAKEAMNYIKSKISTPSRITGKGYGETQLANNCACECDELVSKIGLAAFRECEDKQLANNCDDSYHQQNRRSEFKVISGGSNIRVNDAKRVPVANGPNSAREAFKATNRPKESSEAQTQPGIYLVKAGDSVYTISRATGIPMNKIIELNKLRNADLIREGQKLKLK